VVPFSRMGATFSGRGIPLTCKVIASEAYRGREDEINRDARVMDAIFLICLFKFIFLSILFNELTKGKNVGDTASLRFLS